MADETPTANPADYDPVSYDETDDTGLFGDKPTAEPGLVDQSGLEPQISDTTLDQMSTTGLAPGESVQPTGQAGQAQAAVDKAFKAGEATADAQGQVGEAIAGKNEAEATRLEDRAAQEKFDEQDTNDLKAAHDKALFLADGEAKAYEEKVRDFQYHDYWADKSAGSKALAILFQAIGGGASTYAKQPNQALLAIQHLEDQDFKKQQQGLINQTKFAEWKREGVKDLDIRLGKERAELLHNQAKKLEHLGEYAKAQYLRSGKTVEESQNNVLSKGLFQKAAEKRAESQLTLYKLELARQARLKKKGTGNGAFNPSADEKLAAMARDPRVTPEEIARYKASNYKTPKEWARASSVVKEAQANKPSGEQQKSAVQADLGLSAIADIDRLNHKPSQEAVNKWLRNQAEVEAAAKRDPKIAQGLKKIGWYAENEYDGLSDKDQKYFNAVRRYMEAYGRAQSGAAISQSEWNNFSAQFGPQAPDGLAKAKAHFENMKATSGVAGARLDESKAGRDKAFQEVTQRNAKTGETRKVRRYKDGREEVIKL